MALKGAAGIASPSAVKEAVDALTIDAGTDPERAEALVEAAEVAAACEAVDIIAGNAQAFGSAVDRRVAILSRIIDILGGRERMPTAYEVGVIFRITPAQGNNVLRTYQARFSGSYRPRLEKAVKKVRSKVKVRNGDKVYVFDFDNPEVLEYAKERLGINGLSRSVVVDSTRLDLVVACKEKDRFGRDAAEVLS